jgi:hypothetical protein
MATLEADEWEIIVVSILGKVNAASRNDEMRLGADEEKLR